MNKEEFDEAIAQANNRAEKERRMISKTYAMANNPYSIGDVIEDHIGFIRIEKILINCIDEYPACVYQGLALTKKLEPRKDGSRRDMWQRNVKSNPIQP